MKLIATPDPRVVLLESPKAVLGLNCPEIHVCGGMEGAVLAEAMAKEVRVSGLDSSEGRARGLGLFIVVVGNSLVLELSFARSERF